MFPYSQKQLKAIGMHNRIYTLRAKARDTNRTIGTDVPKRQDFVKRIEKLNADQQRAVFCDLVADDHANLAHAMMEAGAGGLGAEILRTQSENTLNWALWWPLISQFDLEVSTFRTWHTLPDLPIEAWVALGNHITSLEKGAPILHPSGAFHLDAFSGAVVGKRQRMGRTVLALYQHFEPQDQACVYPAPTPAFINRRNPFSDISHVMLGLLAGWPLDYIQKAYHVVSHRHDGMYHTDSIERAFRNESAHEWMSLANACASLTDEERLEAMGALKEKDTYGLFDQRSFAILIQNTPVLNRVFGTRLS